VYAILLCRFLVVEVLVVNNMKIPFSQISTTGQQYSLDLQEFATEKEIFSLQGMVSLSCLLQRKSADRIFLQGRIQATLLLYCDRCLQQYVKIVDSKLSFICETDGSSYHRMKEIDLTTRDLDIVQLEEAVIDLSEIIRQQLYLSVPQRRLCKEDCKGICSICGTDMNCNPCRCSREPANNPFAVLAALKEK